MPCYSCHMLIPPNLLVHDFGTRLLIHSSVSIRWLEEAGTSDVIMYNECCVSKAKCHNEGGAFEESSEIGWLAGMSDMFLFSCYVLCISIPGVASAVFRPGQALTPTFDPTRTRLSHGYLFVSWKTWCSLCVYFFSPVVFSHLVCIASTLAWCVLAMSALSAMICLSKTLC